jgi:anti-sigma regulatory factor (Ser/Thr protein kinase)
MNAPSYSKTTLRIANAIGELPRVVAFVEEFGHAKGLPARAVNDLNLCLDEMLTNTISYGYESSAPRVISVSLSAAGGYLQAEIEDDAKPFDPRRSAPPELPRDLASRKIGGLGLHFVNSLMDVVDYRWSDGYNQTTLKKACNRRLAGSEEKHK